MAVEGPRGFYFDANKGNGTGTSVRQTVTTVVETLQRPHSDNKYGGLGRPLLPGDEGKQELPMNPEPLYANVVGK